MFGRAGVKAMALPRFVIQWYSLVLQRSQLKFLDGGWTCGFYEYYYMKSLCFIHMFVLYVGDSFAILRAELKSQKKHVRSLQEKSLWSRILEEVINIIVLCTFLLHIERNGSVSCFLNVYDRVLLVAFSSPAFLCLQYTFYSGHCLLHLSACLLWQ